MSSSTSILDLISPPNGYVFDAGVWTTHDLSVRALNTLVLPALAGLGTTDRSGGISAPAELGSARLLVAAAEDRITADAFVPATVTTIIPIGGPRQHSKGVVLRYKRTDNGVNGPPYVTLVVVTSANLTAAGMTSNRENVYAEWVTSNAHGVSIVRDVLQELRPLSQAAHGRGHSYAWTKAINDLASRIPKTCQRARAPEGPKVFSSIGWDLGPDAGFPEQAFRELFTPDEVRRVALIGPAFADNNSDVCALLEPVLGADTQVHLVVNTRWRSSELAGGHRAVHVPRKLLAGLRKRTLAGEVLVYGAAIDDTGAEGNRTLHGKTIVVETDRGTWHLVGSANLTRSGLAGRNRELVVLRPGQPGDIDRALTDVRAHPALHIVDVDLKRVEPPPESDPETTAIHAEFVPDSGQHALRGFLRGDLRVFGVDLNAVIHLANGQKIQLRNGVAKGVLLDTSNPSITVGSSHRPLLLHIKPADDSFWSSTPLDTERPQGDPLFDHLRRDYTRTTTTQISKGQASGLQDGFAVPLNRALNAVTRYADQIAAWPQEHVEHLLDAYFRLDDREAAVARAVLDAARSGEARSGIKPLSLLTAAVVAHAGGH